MESLFTTLKRNYCKFHWWYGWIYDDESEFFGKLQHYHDNWSVKSFLEDLEDDKNVICLDDVKVGEDTGKYKYFGCKTK